MYTYIHTYIHIIYIYTHTHTYVYIYIHIKAYLGLLVRCPLIDVKAAEARQGRGGGGGLDTTILG
jgi:hypothetical protein